MPGPPARCSTRFEGAPAGVTRVLLHVGTHKTGSTAVQAAFAANRRLLARHGIVYPSLPGRSATHHGLAAVWNRNLASVEPRGGAAAAWASLARRHAGGDGVLVLSSEEFGRTLGRQAVDHRALRAALSVFERVDVLCLVRDQLSFLESVWLQIARASQRVGKGDSALPPWPRFHRRAVRTGAATNLALDYDALIGRLDDAFGPEHVHVVPYAQAAGEPGGVIGLVLRTIDRGLDASALDLSGGARRHVTGSPLAIWAATEVSAPDRPSDALIAALTPVVAERFGPRTTLYTPAQRRAVTARFGPANARLAERLAGRRPGFALPWADHEGAADPRRADRRFWIAVARALSALA